MQRSHDGTPMPASWMAMCWSVAVCAARPGVRLVAAVLVWGAAGAPAVTVEPPDTPQAAAPLDGRDGRPLALERFRPEPMLRVEAHDVRRAKFPVVDVHVHPRYRLRHSPELLDEYVAEMDRQNIAVCVSLDGRLGDELAEHLRYLEKYRDRFVVFANLDWQGSGADDDPATWACHQPEFARRMVAALQDARRAGVVGLKLFKDFGLRYRNPDGSLLRIDDPRWDPIWDACGRLGLVVLIHTADPAAFFQPVDERNERWEELRRHPDWSFYGPQWPKREELLAARNRVIQRHPQTTFIGAHVANNPEDLATVARWLDTYPNLHVEIAARIGELGRQPYTARRFFVQYQDRIMFGTDGPRAAERLHLHWRFLETWDEYFPYAETPFPPQGFWRIYGLGLPDEVLRKVYYENACRIIPGVREKWEAYCRRAQP